MRSGILSEDQPHHAQHDGCDSNLLLNVNRQIQGFREQCPSPTVPKSHENKPPIEDVDKREESQVPVSPQFNYNSTLRARQQSWIDPLEPRIHSTFYHKDLDTLRPRYSFLLRHGTHNNVDAMFADCDSNAQSPALHHNYSQRSSNASRRYHLSRAHSELANDANPHAHAHPRDVEDQSMQRSHTSSWESEDAKLQENAQKFGTLKGVFSRCLLNIFGVIMFLRMGFLVSQAGVLLSIVIILLCASVTFITTLSMSAIATNGQIKGGGLYYMISRSLGPAFGGTVGLLFGVGNAIATSMYLIGFAEVIYAIHPLFGDDKLTNVRIISNLALLCETVLALLGGMKLVMRFSMVLLTFIVAVVLLIFVGSTYQLDGAHGIIGWKHGFESGNFGKNAYSAFSAYDGIEYDFFQVLALFFPACTGIMAGANISSQLKSPSKSIPTGTLGAIGCTTVVYIVLVLVLGVICTREALRRYDVILQYVSVYAPLFLAGVFAASLSAAITSLTSAPAILKSVVDDNIVPILTPICGNRDTDRQMMIISVCIACVCNLLGSLNAVAPLITDFYLIAYGIINLSCVCSSFSKSPGWRPDFLYYNKYLALCGSILCFVFMMLSNLLYAIMALCIAFLLYQYISYVDPDVDWGKVSESRQYYDAFHAVLRLNKSSSNKRDSHTWHVKHWRPGFLVLCGDPLHRPYLIHFANTLSKSHSPTFFATIRTDITMFRTNVSKFHQQNYGNYLPRHLLGTTKKGFFDSVFAESFRHGVQMLMQCVGLGALRPNTLVLGYRHNWKGNLKSTHEYIEVVRDALEMGYAVMVLRNFSYIHWTKRKQSKKRTPGDMYPSSTAVTTKTKANASHASIDMEKTVLEDNDEITNEKSENIAQRIRRCWRASSNSSSDICDLHSENSQLPSKSMLQMRCAPYVSQYIDVFWLIDDGGLTVLLPYLMKLHTFWSHCRLRLNLISGSNGITQEYANVCQLMKEFRLPYDKPRLIEVDAENEKPSKQTMQRFHQLMDGEIDFDKNIVRPNVVLKWLKVSELVHQHGKMSHVIVLTLPLPTTFWRHTELHEAAAVAEESEAKDDTDENMKRNKTQQKYMNCKAYFAMLEMLTENLPPVILIRGNGESALTFYSE